MRNLRASFAGIFGGPFILEGWGLGKVRIDMIVGVVGLILAIDSSLGDLNRSTSSCRPFSLQN